MISQSNEKKEEHHHQQPNNMIWDEICWSCRYKMYRNQSRRTKAVEDGATSRDSDLARPHPPPDARPMYNDRMRHPKDRHAVKKATPNAPLLFLLLVLCDFTAYACRLMPSVSQSTVKGVSVELQR